MAMPQIRQTIGSDYIGLGFRAAIFLLKKVGSHRQQENQAG